MWCRPNASGWTHDPFGGVVADAAIGGRGALDMKGLGLLQLMSVVWFNRLRVPLKRDVVLIAVADEEVSNQGAKQVFSDDAFWSTLKCGHVLNEGALGSAMRCSMGRTCNGSVAEKGTLGTDYRDRPRWAWFG